MKKILGGLSTDANFFYIEFANRLFPKTFISFFFVVNTTIIVWINQSERSEENL